MARRVLPPPPHGAPLATDLSSSLPPGLQLLQRKKNDEEIINQSLKKMKKEM
jgi:hypothetical protein